MFQTPSRTSNFDSISARRSTAIGGQTPLLLECKRVDDTARFDDEAAKENSVERSGPAGELKDNKFRVTFNNGQSVSSTGLKLGTGGFGSVYAVIDVHTGHRYALKVSTVAMKEADHRRLKEEVAILNMFKNHPHIVQYVNVGIMSDNRAYVLLEKCSSQALQDVIAKRGGFNLDEVLWVSYQLCSTIRDLHASGCIHRDLKPANLLFDFEGNLKVIDFGLSTRLGGQRSRRTIAGTAVFMAPEMVKLLKRAFAKKGGAGIPQQEDMDGDDIIEGGDDTYSNEIDVWAIGIIMMSMFMGYSPYKEAMKGCNKAATAKERQQYLIETVVANKISWGDQEKKVDPDLKELISQILTVNQRDRPTLDEILEHPVWERRPRTTPATLMQALGLLERKSSSRALSARFSTVGRPSVADFLKKNLEKIEEIEVQEREQMFSAFLEQHKAWTQVNTAHQLENASRKIIAKEEDKEFYRLMNQKRNSLHKGSGTGRSSSVALAQGGGNLMLPPSPNNQFPQPLSGHPSPTYKIGIRRSVSVRSSSTARSTRGDPTMTDTTYSCMNNHLMTKVTQIPQGYVGYDCNVCGAEVNKLSRSMYMYRCEKCDFDICRVCAEGHKEVEQVFICDTCDKKFPTEQKMNKHSLTCRGPSIAGAPSPSNTTTSTTGGKRNSGRARVTNDRDNDERRAENESSFEKSLSKMNSIASTKAPRESNRSVGGASRISTGTILLGADLDEADNFMGTRTDVDEDPLRPLPAGFSKSARGRKTSSNNGSGGGAVPRLTGRMSMQMPESVSVKRGRNSLQTLDLEIEDDSEELRRQQEEADADVEEPVKKRQRNSKEEESGGKTSTGNRKSKTTAAKRLSGTQLPEGDEVPATGRAAENFAQPQTGNSGGNSSRNPSVTPSNASAASGRQHIELNLLGADKPGEPYTKATHAPRHINPSKSRQRSVSHVRVPQSMVQSAEAPVAMPEARFPGVYNGGGINQQNYSNMSSGMINNNNQSRATSVGTNQTNNMMLPGGMSTNASPLQDPRGGGPSLMGMQQQKPARAESVPVQELPNGQKYVTIGGQTFLLDQSTANSAQANAGGVAGGFTYNNPTMPGPGANNVPRLPGQVAPSMAPRSAAPSTVRGVNMQQGYQQQQEQQYQHNNNNMMMMPSGNGMNQTPTMMPPAPGMIARPQQQQQQQPLNKPPPKRGYMALPEDKNNLQKYVSDFLSGAWVRQYCFCDEGPVFMYYSVQPGRWGALFQNEVTSHFSTIVVDVNTKTAVISYDMDDNESYAHRSDGGQHGVQTTYHDRCEIASLKVVQQAFPDIIEGILAFVDKMVRMRSEGIPPATVSASYIHESEAASVPVTVPFAYVRKAFPDPNNTFCLFRLSNRRSQVIWNATEFDIRWQASRSSDVSLKYYVPRTGEISPFNKDDYDLMKKVNALLNEHPHTNQ